MTIAMQLKKRFWSTGWKFQENSSTSNYNPQFQNLKKKVNKINKERKRIGKLWNI